MENNENMQNESLTDSNKQVQHPQANESQRLTGNNANEDDTSLASDGPVSKNEGTESHDLNDTSLPNDRPMKNADGTSKGFDRDQEEINLGLDDGDLDNDVDK